LAFVEMALAEPLTSIESHVEHPVARAKRPVIIDSDAGIDDAQALVLALRSEAVHILAVTATHGNVALGHVEGNICACLEVTSRLDLPVYLGAETPLVHVANEDASEWHGADGLGNTKLGVTAPRTCIRSDMTAAHALAHITLTHLEKTGDKVDIVTLGPLTNLCLAVRLQPRIATAVGTVFVMGGAETGHGNVAFPSLTAEYNIYADPEAAAVVFGAFPNIVLSSWQLTLKYGCKPDFLAEYLTRATPCGRFLSDVTQHLLAASGEEYVKERGLMIPDPLAVCIALRPDIITASSKHAVFVETTGMYTRGMTVVDWRDASGKPRNVEVVEAVDAAAVRALLLESVRP
jgi:purine nucleosidase